MTDIVVTLRSRKEFFKVTGSGAWYLGPGPDADCQAAADQIERLRAENSRFRQALFGGNVTAPRDDLAASQGPKQPAKA